MTRRLLVLDLPGLQLEHFNHPDRMPHLTSLRADGELHRMRTVFPAVTLPVQASLTTGLWPQSHGVVSNGFFFPETLQVSFWEQSAALVQGERLWDTLRRKDPQRRCASLFLQNTLYADCDIVLTPKPLHTEEGLIPWCYGKPVGLYDELTSRLGHFPLHHYWGPMASVASSRWIAEAASDVLDRYRPDVAFVYLPHLDYAGQKYPPGDEAVLQAVSEIDAEVGRIIQGVESSGLASETAIVVFSEYALHEARGDIPLNRHLRRAGLLQTRTIAGCEYLDMERSGAFAMVDHQIAHIYVRPGQLARVRCALEPIEGIDHLLCGDDRRAHRIDHPRSGDLVAVSSRDRWFSYPWWEEEELAPPFASRVDIHRKPGYDPLELFLEPSTKRISRDTSLVRGSHGYPPVSAADDVPLLLSRTSSPPQMPEQLCITHLPLLLNTILG